MVLHETCNGMSVSTQNSTVKKQRETLFKATTVEARIESEVKLLKQRAGEF